MNVNPALFAVPNELLLFGGIILLLLFIVFLGLFIRYFNLWIQCKMTKAGIGFVSLMLMDIRKVNPTVIVRSKIMAVQAGLTRSYPISISRVISA